MTDLEFLLRRSFELEEERIKLELREKREITDIVFEPLETPVKKKTIEGLQIELPDELVERLRNHIRQLGVGWNLEKGIVAAVEDWVDGPVADETHAESCLQDIINTLRAHGHEVDGE